MKETRKFVPLPSLSFSIKDLWDNNLSEKVKKQMEDMNSDEKEEKEQALEKG
jgi:hypothetical protein|tara:strand:+ start:440 stop:595 length:156 start_codon:yes stop_codon:yes gene_type:complete